MTRFSTATSLSCPGCGAAAQPTDAACRYCERVLSSVACEHCFARLFAGMQYCAACGSRSNFSEPENGTDALACPGCGDHQCTSLLMERTVGDHTLRECLACHGIWLAMSTVDAITADANARALFAPDAAQSSAVADALTGPAATPARKSSDRSTFRYRRCPVCAKMMSRVNVAKISGVIVDRCSQHGTFFDIDELHTLVRFLERGGLDRARAREREALAEERRRLQMLLDLDARRRSMEYSRTEGVPATSITSLLAALIRGT